MTGGEFGINALINQVNDELLRPFYNVEVVPAAIMSLDGTTTGDCPDEDTDLDNELNIIKMSAPRLSNLSKAWTKVVNREDELPAVQGSRLPVFITGNSAARAGDCTGMSLRADNTSVIDIACQEDIVNTIVWTSHVGVTNDDITDENWFIEGQERGRTIYTLAHEFLHAFGFGHTDWCDVCDPTEIITDWDGDLGEACWMEKEVFGMDNVMEYDMIAPLEPAYDWLQQRMRNVYSNPGTNGAAVTNNRWECADGDRGVEIVPTLYIPDTTQCE